jgi:hypothetical protein
LKKITQVDQPNPLFPNNSIYHTSQSPHLITCPETITPPQTFIPPKTTHQSSNQKGREKLTCQCFSSRLCTVPFQKDLKLCVSTPGTLRQIVLARHCTAACGPLKQLTAEAAELMKNG